MSFSDLETYLKGHGINTNKAWSETNSKWVYAKEMLADTPDELIGKIATELEIDHSISSAKNADSRFWSPGHLRVFISHISAHKVTASNLQLALKRYAMSSFVAHEDIEPTREWLSEIERALFSMDALIAILTPEFPDSQWTDHEVGIAVGREVLVLPIRKGKDPYGFIGKYQGLQSHGKTVASVAEAVYRIFISNPKTADKLFGALVRQLLVSGNSDDVTHWMNLLLEQDEIPRNHMEKLQTSIVDNEFIMNDEESRSQLKTLFERQGLAMPARIAALDADDDIPF